MSARKSGTAAHGAGSRMNWPMAAAIAVIATVVGAVIGFAVASNRAVELQIRQGDRVALLTIAGAEVDYEKLLETFFEPGNEWLRGAAKNWLLEKHDILSVTSTQLAEKLEAKACGEFAVTVKPAPERYFEDLDHRGKCAVLPNVKALRQLARTARPPFHDVAELANATIPHPQAYPEEGTVDVCASRKDLDSMRIELVSPRRTGESVFAESIVRTARARMECTRTSFAEINLRPEDAAKLTGEERPNMPVPIYFSRVQLPPGARPGHE